MKNVTITVDDAALEWARIEAARRNTSVSRLVGEMLAEKMQRTDAYQRAMHDWQTKDRLWASDGRAYPKPADPEGPGV
ncbi:MAG: CopG family transcriptional regulator [Pseudomonadota bacterium]